MPPTSELERLAEAGTSVAHCPGSNASLGSGCFPLKRHVEAGVTCALGTDVGGGLGFGMMKEGLQAYLMQRLAPDPIALDAPRLLYLSTRAGAEALGLNAEIGDFRPGKAADFVYLRPPEGSVLEAAVRRADEPRAGARLVVHDGRRRKRARSTRRRGYRILATGAGGPPRRAMTLADLNEKDRAGFIEAVGWVFEDSPWVAERAWQRRPFASLDALHEAMTATVAGATLAEQLALLRAHPDLGARMVRLKPDTTDVDSARTVRLKPDTTDVDGVCTGSVRLQADEMSDASKREQAGAGLDSLTREEFDRLRALNGAYREKFGFPFLFAVKGSTKQDVLNALERRLTSTRDAEQQEALRQVYQIARFRLAETVGQP